MKTAAYRKRLETDISWSQRELGEIRDNPAYQRRASALTAKLKGLRRKHRHITAGKSATQS